MTATLYREIDALGGSATTDRDRGYVAAINDVLTILAKRGFSEEADATGVLDNAPKPLTVRELGEYGRYIHGADYFDNSIEAVVQRQARFTELNDRYLATRSASAIEAASVENDNAKVSA